MTAVDEIVSHIALSQLATQLGVDQTPAEQATRQALPALLGGMQANAQNPGGAASLTEAPGQHADNGLLEEGVNLAQVDTAQGDQIVSHVFGDKRGDVVNHLGGLGGSGGIGAAGAGPGGLGNVLGGLLGGGRR